jgi:hypothetical protein
VRNANTLAIAVFIEQALCLCVDWKLYQEGGRREDKQPPAIGNFCKRASGLKKPLAL